ncbi:hypothetical protein BDY19DRAFT_998877 [Irpex rosettiformis]|uniref:Uncharacterized protein n=1 Tax=Irpex rosettiformis TaxID=378272 RepID=A0ACB8TM62_9APHY|nr:hypothetical protein BDY19DRAFT_998877 [Irpex rosettiformis]
MSSSQCPSYDAGSVSEELEFEFDEGATISSATDDIPKSIADSSSEIMSLDDDEPSFTDTDVLSHERLDDSTSHCTENLDTASSSHDTDTSAVINKGDNILTNIGSSGEAQSDIIDEFDEEETLEEELEDRVHPGPTEIRGWNVLREQVKTKLQRGKKILTMSQVNQLLIIRNFATLRLKGIRRIPASEEIARQWHESTSATYFARHVRALARHYQVFEQLPVERRGGGGNAHSLLNDPNIKHAARE